MLTGGAWEFVVDDGAGPAAARIAAALLPRATIIQEARRQVRQVWLDTFDWRLHAGGLVLRQVTGPGAGELVLSTAAGEIVAAEPLPAQRWPRLAGVIPAGRLRGLVEPLAGVRALLPLARTEGTLTRLRVLDAEHKTVARIIVDAASLAEQGGKAGQPLPARLTLEPVRGYQAVTGQAARLLAAGEGIRLAERPGFESVLAAAGRQPGEDTGKVGVAGPSSAPAAVALAGVLLGLADAIEANVGFVIRDVNIEFLHDLRVAVRRTRSAVKLAGDVLPGDLAGRFAPEFKWLGDLTTPTRDLDVYLSGFGEMTSGLSAASPADLEPLRAHLAAGRVIEHRRLVRGLRSARFAALMAGWRAALADAAVAKGRRGPDIGRLAADRIARAQRQVARRGAAITGSAAVGGPPAEDLHALRKRGKELRYLLEFFGPLQDPVTLRRAVRDLKGLQDCLGEFQDAEVQQHAIRGFAAAMIASRDTPPPPLASPDLASPDLTSTELTSTELAATLLAMGELTAQLHERQLRARDEIAGRFAAFSRAGSLRRLGTAPRTARS